MGNFHGISGGSLNTGDKGRLGDGHGGEEEADEPSAIPGGLSEQDATARIVASG